MITTTNRLKHPEHSSREYMCADIIGVQKFNLDDHFLSLA
jgi:hypothetical protein